MKFYILSISFVIQSIKKEDVEAVDKKCILIYNSKYAKSGSFKCTKD